MSATDVYASGIFDRAKAKLLYEAGRFLQNRDRILRMIDIADLMRRKAEGIGDGDMSTIASRLRGKLDGLYSRQISLEESVQAALSGLSSRAGGNALELVQSVVAMAPTLKRLAVHVGSVKLAQKATDELKARTLTAADLATLDRAPAIVTGGIVAAAGVGIFGLWFLSRRRRR